MGLFFRSTPRGTTVRTAVTQTVADDPCVPQRPHEMADAVANQVQTQMRGPFGWGQVAVAIGLLVAVFVACLSVAHDEKLTESYKLLIHAFDLLLGAAVGLITGEAVARP